MVTLYRGPNWKISIYGRDHGVPHFHIEGREFRASVGIVSLDVIVGVAPGDVLAEATAWASERQYELLAKWQELNP